MEQDAKDPSNTLFITKHCCHIVSRYMGGSGEFARLCIFSVEMIGSHIALVFYGLNPTTSPAVM